MPSPSDRRPEDERRWRISFVRIATSSGIPRRDDPNYQWYDQAVITGPYTKAVEVVPASRVEQLERENERLKDALGFYSDGFKYLSQAGVAAIWRDKGDVARAALKKQNG